MLENLLQYYHGQSFVEMARDVLDVFIVYYIFYRLLLVARGTRAIQIAAGLGIISLLYVVAQTFELVTIVTLVGALLQSIILVIVVVFQNDIRRALQRVGSRAFFGGSRAQETEVIEQVVEAARELARHRIGAIITFEQDANLNEFVGQNKGIDIDAQVSAELLVSLFVPEGSNKLHDGAVIIRNLRIAKAGVFFPMPENRSFESSFGSRHRAALGITEETDAVVVVVSEERGTISFCFNGNIAPNLQANQLREMLFSIMSPKAAKPRGRGKEQRDSTARVSVSIRSSVESKPDDKPAPISTRMAGKAMAGKAPSAPPLMSEAPPPLRKSALPGNKELAPIVDEEDSLVSESVHLPPVQPRPMPKASEVDTAVDSEDLAEEERRTPN